MCLKILKLMPMLLLLNTARIDAASLNCGDKDAAACKLEFEHQLDDKFKNFYLDMTKHEIKDIINVFEMALKELPAKDTNANLLQDSIKALKEDLVEYDANKHDNEKLRNITNHVEQYMQPHLIFASGDQKTIPELEKLLEKYNYTYIMEQFDINIFLMAFSKMWNELFVDLRKSDLKEYAEYSEINDIMKKLINEQNEEKITKLLRQVLKKVREFCKIPSLEDLVFYEGRKTGNKQ